MTYGEMFRLCLQLDNKRISCFPFYAYIIAREMLRDDTCLMRRYIVDREAVLIGL